VRAIPGLYYSFFFGVALDSRKIIVATQTRKMPIPIGVPHPRTSDQSVMTPIPIMIGGNGPRAQRLAASHADVWSCYPEERSHVDEFAPRLASLEAACELIGRDPATLRRSAGVSVKPLQPEGDSSGARIAGSPDEIADAIRAFREAGYTQLEIMMTPVTMAALEALAPVLELLDAD
jgi:alkanesulfonate monooxygenase SsuD/methylene tetrahydromethanopterin reductase-like flavin-dependent oxidoreductase (luciferase family)